MSQRPQHTMIGHLPIWTVTVDETITQARDFDDVLVTLGKAVLATKEPQHVTIQDGETRLFDAEISVTDKVEVQK